MAESELRSQLVEVVARQNSLIEALTRTLQATTRELDSLKAKVKDREEQQALVEAAQTKPDPRAIA
ncbi:MAG: hypothetical protein ABSA81_03065 [Candidatus Bathyarchaeia archaeon]|jgi:peptidoglycan hydrolase CwlO-like protein